MDHGGETEHINILELWAITGRHRHLSQNRENLTFWTAVVQVNKMVGTRSGKLVGIIKQLCVFSIQKKLLLSGEYLPRRLNVEADRLSRVHADASDWQLDTKIFESLNKKR